MVRDTLIFDLDDTLISTHHHYSKARINSTDMIAKTLGNSITQEFFDYSLYNLYEFIYKKAGHRAPEILSLINVEDSITDQPIHSFARTAEFFASKLDFLLDEKDYSYLYSIKKTINPNLTRETDKIASARYIVRLNSKIDVERVSKLGFQKERFPGSIILTYEALCKENNQKVYPEIISKLLDIASHPFKEEVIKKTGLLSGVEETLDYVASQDHELHLLTKGDEEVQNMKVRSLELSRWFSPENIHVVSTKKDSVLENIASNAVGNRVYKIGNSYGSDIRPALAAGIKAMYVPCETWAWEKINDGDKPNPEADGVIVLDNISQLKERYS